MIKTGLLAKRITNKLFAVRKDTFYSEKAAQIDFSNDLSEVLQEYGLKLGNTGYPAEGNKETVNEGMDAIIEIIRTELDRTLKNRK